MSNSRARNGTLTDRSEIAWAYNSGESIEAMAKRYGLPLSTMRHRLMKAGVRFRKPGNPRLQAMAWRKNADDSQTVEAARTIHPPKP